MRVKFTIAVCALLVLALGASQAYAQAGYTVARSINTVAEHGKNQMMGDIQLGYIPPLAVISMPEPPSR